MTHSTTQPQPSHRTSAHPLRRVLAVVAILAAAVLAPLAGSSPAVAAGPFIQPGEYLETVHGSDIVACTLGFVFDGAGAGANAGVYASSAAHCAAAVGDSARLSDGTVFGRVVLQGNPDTHVDDYLFIEVFPAYASRVRAFVKGYPQYPKGYTRSAETASGDWVQLSGYGMGVDATAQTREQRQGVLVSDSASEAKLAGPSVFGDSGGPLVHVRTGKALGLVSHACIDVCTDVVPTIEWVVARAAARGFPVVLRTV